MNCNLFGICSIFDDTGCIEVLADNHSALMVMIIDNIDLSTFTLSVELEMRRREDEYRFTSK